MAHKGEEIRLLDLVTKIATKIGIRKLSAHLSEIDKSASEADNEQGKQEVIVHVANAMKLKPQYLTDGEKWSRDDAKYWGITYIIIILSKHLKFRPDNIGDIFQMSKKNITRRLREFNALDKENKIDKTRLEPYVKIENSLIEKGVITIKK